MREQSLNLFQKRDEIEELEGFQQQELAKVKHMVRFGRGQRARRDLALLACLGSPWDRTCGFAAPSALLLSLFSPAAPGLTGFPLLLPAATRALCLTLFSCS